jgi:ABC-type bacteriocin/lantibiotic exporter with double-glycine peptidase domain
MQRVKTPLRLQMELAECGAVALGIVLEYYGKYVALENLRQACHVSRNGSRASDIVAAAQAYGLEAHAYRREIETVSTLPLPHIVFWNMNHFVVVEGYSRDHIWLNDPQAGHRTISPTEFARSFTGVVLTFSPAAVFVADGQVPRLMGRLWQLSSHQRYRIAVLIVLSLMALGPALLVPAALQQFVTQVFALAVPDPAQLAFVQLVVITLLTALLTSAQLEMLLQIKLRWWISLPTQFFSHLLRLPISFLQQRPAGELATRAELPYRLVELASDGLGGSLLSLLWIVAYALLLGQFSLPIMGVGLGFAVLTLLALRLGKQRELQHRLVLSQARLGAITSGGLQAIETLKVHEGNYWQRLMGEFAGMLNHQLNLSRYVQWSWLFPLWLTTAALSASLVVGSGQIIAGLMLGSAWFAVQWLLSRLLSPVNELLWLGTRWQDGQAINQRLEDVLSQPAPVAAVRPVAEGLRCTQVRFGYHPRAPLILKGIDLAVDAGEWVALVGKVGCGKTTLAQLAAGIYAPLEGAVAVPPRVALVANPPSLFTGSVRENMTLWDEQTPDAEIEAATRHAGIHETILARDGYDSLVEEGGQNFSNGERQRLELARALITHPQLLILDEATAAIDPALEAHILNQLRALPMTVLLISHRLSAVQRCDRIAVLQDGLIVESGSHEALLAQGGVYAGLRWND